MALAEDMGVNKFSNVNENIMRIHNGDKINIKMMIMKCLILSICSLFIHSNLNLFTPMSSASAISLSKIDPISIKASTDNG
jgi:hypothetical protein